MQRAQYLHLLVADRVGGEVDRRFHRRDRDELEQMVLKDVAHRSRLLVERGASFDAERLRDRDLDMVDELSVPDRLEDAVRESQREHVLDRLLAEIVVDAKDLALDEVLGEQFVECARGGEVVTERLLDDQPRPALRRPALRDLAHERGDRARWHCEVVDAIAVRAAFLVELAEQCAHAVLVAVVAVAGFERAVAHAARELVPDFLVELVAGVGLYRLLHPLAKLVVARVAAGGADDGETFG